MSESPKSKIVQKKANSVESSPIVEPTVVTKAAMSETEELIKNQEDAAKLEVRVVPPVQSYDKETIKYIVYLLYKSNMIARNNLREVLQIIESPTPEKLLEYLVIESKK